MSLVRPLMIAVAAACLMACQPKAPAPADAPAADLASPGAHAVTGEVLKVDDAGYPMFVLTVRPEGQTGELTLSVNAEAADLGGAELGAFAGKQAEIAFSVADRPQLIDVKRDGKSLIEPMEAQLERDGAMTIAGVLSGAAAPTAGDLPDEITVTDAAGKATVFEYFVTPELVAANGQTVEAVYAMGREENVTAMKLKP